MARLELDDEELARVEADALREGPHTRVLEELAGLPADQRAAVEARVLHELAYAQIALTGQAPRHWHVGSPPRFGCRG
jgi:DNA-directed RNA polymerase specialized sigma24 family protein